MIDKLINEAYKKLELVPKNSTKLVEVNFDPDVLKDPMLEKNGQYAEMLQTIRRQSPAAGRTHLSEWAAAMVGCLHGMLLNLKKNARKEVPVQNINKVYQCYQTMRSSSQATSLPEGDGQLRLDSSLGGKGVRFESSSAGERTPHTPGPALLSPVTGQPTAFDNAINQGTVDWSMPPSNIAANPAGTPTSVPAYGTFKDEATYHSTIESSSLIDQEHLEYNRKLHIMAREHNLVQREREAREEAEARRSSGASTPTRQGGDRRGAAPAAQGPPMAAARRAALPKFQENLAAKARENPLQSSAHELLATYHQRDLFESYRARSAALHPRTKVVKKVSMRDSPNLVPETPRPQASEPGSSYQFRAAPPRTPQVEAAMRHNARPHTAPAKTSWLAGEDVDMAGRLKRADDGPYLAQIRATVATWSRGRARREEESLRRQEASRYASQTGQFQHKKWSPKEAFQGVLPAPLGEPPKEADARPSAPRIPSNSSSDDDGEYGTGNVSRDDDDDDIAARYFMPAEEEKAPSSSDHDVDEGKGEEEQSNAYAYGLNVSSGPLPTPRNRPVTIDPHALMLSPYTNLDVTPPVSRIFHSHSLDHAGFTSPHPDTVCPDKPWGPKPVRLADVVAEREAEKKRKRLAARAAKKKGADAKVVKKKTVYVPSTTKKKKTRKREPPPHVPSSRRDAQLRELAEIDAALARHSISLRPETAHSALLLPEDRVHSHCMRLLPRPGSALISNPMKEIMRQPKKKRKAGGGGGGGGGGGRPRTAPARPASRSSGNRGPRPQRARPTASEPIQRGEASRAPNRLRAGEPSNMIASLTTGVRPRTSPSAARVTA